MKPDRFYDVGAGMFGGFRVASMLGMRCEGSALFDCANDVAAAAALAGVAVLTNDPSVTQACAALGVAVLAAPAVRQESMPI